MADNYLDSKFVKVYPTARRGEYADTTVNKTYTYDPEARIPSEYNQVNHHSKTTAKSSYIVSYNGENGYLNCVIGGYYFEITTDIRAYNYLGINIETVDLVKHTADTRSTTVLASFVGGDSKLDNASGKFTGLLATTELADIREKADDYLQIFVVPTPDGEAKKINPEALLIDTIILTGSGENSIVGKDNTNSGDFSVTLGKNNTNSGDYSFVYGNTNENKGTSNLIIGSRNTNGATADNNGYTNLLLVGSNITSNANNQVIFKGYDTYDFDNKITIGNNGATTINIAADTNGNTLVFNIKDPVSSIFKITKAGLATLAGKLVVESTSSESEFKGAVKIKSLTCTGSATINGDLTCDAPNALIQTANAKITNDLTVNNILAGTVTTTGDVMIGIQTTDNETDNETPSSNITITAAGQISGPENTYSLGTTAASLYGATINNSELKLTTQKLTLGNGNITIQETNGVLEIIC